MTVGLRCHSLRTDGVYRLYYREKNKKKNWIASGQDMAPYSAENKVDLYWIPLSSMRSMHEANNVMHRVWWEGFVPIGLYRLQHTCLSVVLPDWRLLMHTLSTNYAAEECDDSSTANAFHGTKALAS